MDSAHRHKPTEPPREAWAGVLLVDEAGRITSCTGALAQELALPIAGSSDGACPPIEERLASPGALRGAVRACLGTGKAVAFDLQLVDAAGETSVMAALAMPLGEPGAKGEAVVVLGPQVSEPEAPQAPAGDVIWESEVRRVIGELAHELNRPLAAVLNYAELALEEPDLPTMARSRLEMVVRHAERSREVVRGWAELGAASTEPATVVNVNAAATRAADSLAHEVEAEGVELALALAADLPEVTGSPADLESVVRNLLENAIAAAGKSAATPRVEVTTERTERGVRLVVRDNGAGIAAEVAERLFEPFVTTKPPGEGTGLGLSIVRRIVTEHEGKISVASPPEGGAVVTVELPGTAVTDEPPVLQEGEGGTSTGEPPVARTALTGETPVLREGRGPARGDGEIRPGQRKALLIDDDESMRKLLGTYLETLGYASMEAGDGAEGLQAALAEDYDIIVCDVNMPNHSGLQFYHDLKAAAPDQTERVIFSTGVLPTDTTSAALRALPNPTLQKPYRLASLRAVLAKAEAAETDSRG